MKYIITILLVMFLFGIVGAQGHLEDVVYLKNGSIIRGTIIEQIPDVSLKIQTMDGNIFIYEMNDIEKFTKEPVLASLSKRKSPGAAIILSIVMPGGGQVYNQEIAKGAAFFGAFFLIGGIIPMGEWTYPAGGAIMIWSAVDAYRTANRINDRINNKIGFDVVKRDNVYAARLSYRF